MADLAPHQRDLLALCSLTVADDRCDWGVIARQAYRESSLEGLLAGEVVESGKRADRTSWVARVASPDDWEAAYNRADAEWRAAEAVDGRLTAVLDPDFPINLRFIHNLPPFLFYQGDLDAGQDARSIAVVGTRAASRKGLIRASRMARLLTESGITVTSGLALGIDTAAHEGTLDAGGRTIAVLGSGILCVAPRQNRPLAEKIVGAGGLIVSQFFPTAHPARWTFPMRNVVTSGISQGTVVIEASRTSGAKMQARLAYEHGKQVFLIRSLVSNQHWAQEMVDRRQAISITTPGQIMEQIVGSDRLRDASKRLLVRPSML